MALDRDAIAHRWGVPADVSLAVAVGRLAVVKGHGLSVDALARAPGWHVLVAGEGPEREALAARAKDLGVDDRLHLVGRVPAPTAWALTPAADAYVQPSRAEGMSLALLEALAVGAVCLASDIGPNVEVRAPDAVGWILPLDDPAAWAAAWDRLRTTPDVGASLRRAARTAYEHRFAETRMLADYETAIAAAVAGR